MSEWFILTKGLVHVYAHHDRFTLFSIQVKIGIGISNKIDVGLIEEILHM